MIITNNLGENTKYLFISLQSRLANSLHCCVMQHELGGSTSWVSILSMFGSLALVMDEIYRYRGDVI